MGASSLGSARTRQDQELAPIGRSYKQPLSVRFVSTLFAIRHNRHRIMA